MSDVADFFEKSQAGSTYRDLKTLTRAQDQAAAAILNAEISGRALMIGGAWECYEPGPQLTELTALDLSAEMLKNYAPAGSRPVVGDLYDVDFPDGAFDSVVFSLVLHHVARGNWAECTRRVETALTRTARWLAPGGTLFILEYCPHPAWMPVQHALLSATTAFLRAAGQPIVVMHDAPFYERALRSAGLSAVRARPIVPAGVSAWTWFPIFMGVRWLKMPLGVYPKMHVVTAVKERAQLR